MGRALIVVRSEFDKTRAAAWCMKAPMGTRVEFKATKRTIPQNDLLWALLTEVAAQKEHHGRRYSTENWKVIFMHAVGREMQFIPALDGEGFIPLGHSSRDLSIEEMSELIDLIYSWGAQNGVQFHGPHEAEPAEKAA